MTVRIVTDSTCDLPENLVQQYGITVVPLYINIGSRGFLDGVELSRKEFYERLADYSPPPTTATPGIEAFQGVYQKLAAEGATEILSIHISVSLSATIEIAQSAASQTTEVPVTAFDSRQLSVGTGFLVLTAAKAAAQGLTVAEILPILNEQIARTHTFAALDTLEFLRRSGRMNGVVAGLGQILQVKPILRMYEGKPTAERVRTREKAIARMIEWLQELQPFEQAALVHANARQRAEELLQRVRHLLPPGDLPIMEITPVIGAHIGTGVVGFALISSRR